MSFIDDIINLFFFCLDHYNLSIMHVSNRDEGIFQCQIQRTMRAFEARSRRVHLTLISRCSISFFFLFINSKRICSSFSSTDVTTNTWIRVTSVSSRSTNEFFVFFFTIETRSNFNSLQKRGKIKHRRINDDHFLSNRRWNKEKSNEICLSNRWSRSQLGRNDNSMWTILSICQYFSTIDFNANWNVL